MTLGTTATAPTAPTMTANDLITPIVLWLTADSPDEGGPDPTAGAALVTLDRDDTGAWIVAVRPYDGAADELPTLFSPRTRLDVTADHPTDATLGALLSALPWTALTP